jgi:hypothetical protein
MGSLADASPLDGVVLGAAAEVVRRSVGPLAWCALEVLATSPSTGDGGARVVRSSVCELATRLGVSKNTANRALKTLRSAGLLEHDQTRGVAGRFDGSSYRLTVSQDVIARSAFNHAGPARPTRRRPSSGGRRQVVVTPDAGEFCEQLVLLTPA